MSAPKSIVLVKSNTITYSFEEWYADIANKDDYSTKEHALNKWNLMCEDSYRLGKNHRGDYQFEIDCEFDEEEIRAAFDELDVNVNNVCERCDKIDDDVYTHPFGCVALCDECLRKDAEPQCPRGGGRDDYCDICNELWDEYDEKKEQQIKDLEERIVAAK